MFYVLDENNNKVEAYDKQGVLALLEQAIADGDLESIASDSAFVDKLKCCVGTGTHHIAFVPQATYNELKANGQLIADAYYFITDDTTADDLNTQLENLTEAVNGVNDAVTALNAEITILNNSVKMESMSSTATITKNGLYSITVINNGNSEKYNFVMYTTTTEEYRTPIRLYYSGTKDGYIYFNTTTKRFNISSELEDAYSISNVKLLVADKEV